MPFADLRGGILDHRAGVDARNANGGTASRSGSAGRSDRRTGGRGARSTILSEDAGSGNGQDGDDRENHSLHYKESPIK